MFWCFYKSNNIMKLYKLCLSISFEIQFCHMTRLCDRVALRHNTHVYHSLDTLLPPGSADSSFPAEFLRHRALPWLRSFKHSVNFKSLGRTLSGETDVFTMAISFCSKDSLGWVAFWERSAVMECTKIWWVLPCEWNRMLIVLPNYEEPNHMTVSWTSF